jgi:hypothetical protein
MDNFTLHTLTWILHGAPAAVFPARELRTLKRDGLVFTYPRMVRIEVGPNIEPIFDSEKRLPLNAPAIAHQLRKRVSGLARSVEFVSATKRAKNMMGGRFGGGTTRLADTDHDFVLAYVYVSLGPKGWVSEPGPFGGEEPDAVIRRRGKTTLVETGGSSYTKEKLIRREAAWSRWHYLLF